MPETLLSTYDEIMNQLRLEGRVTEKTPEESWKIMKKIQEEMDAFRFENQKMARTSQIELASVVLTA